MKEQKDVEYFYQAQAKQIIDSMFDSKVFNEKLTRDNIQGYEDLLAYYFQNVDLKWSDVLPTKEIIKNDFKLKLEIIDGHKFYSCYYCGKKVFSEKNKEYVNNLFNILSEVNLLF